MPVYNVSPENGDHKVIASDSNDFNHDLAIRARGSAPVGIVTITARKPGSDVFESIPDAVIDLSAPFTVQFQGAVAEFNFSISGISGIKTLAATDITQKQ